MAWRNNYCLLEQQIAVAALRPEVLCPTLMRDCAMQVQLEQNNYTEIRPVRALQHLISYDYFMVTV